MNKAAFLKQYALTKYGRRFSSKEALTAYQQKKIKKHLHYVLAHSPFYRSYYKPYAKAVQSGRLDLLPVIDKEMMMDHFDELNTAGIRKEDAFTLAVECERTRNFSPKIGDISIGLSSGTSGNRGLFLVSDKESALWAGTILAKMLPGSLAAPHKIAFFLRANNNLYTKTETGRISFVFFDLLDDLPVHARKLNSLQPSVVVAPPSMLRQIAEWQRDGEIDIHPKKMISVAEVLEEVDRSFIESVFNQTLHQLYQCTEGFLAATCAEGTLHVNEDIVVVEKEYVDREAGVFVPVITDFSRTTQPIIRYRLNDLLVEKRTPCRCGSFFLALERIDGRSDDLFYAKKQEGDGTVSLFPDFIRRAVMFASADILAYQVTQKSIDRLEVKVAVNGDERTAKQAVYAEFNRLWKEKGLLMPHIDFAPYDLVPSDKKRKRIENQMKGIPVHAEDTIT